MIDKLIKLPVRIANCSLLDANGCFILRVIEDDLPILEALCTLINGQNVDVERMSEEWGNADFIKNRLDKYFELRFNGIGRYGSEQAAESQLLEKEIIEAVKYGSTLSQSWVSVEDRLPDEGQAVNIYCEGFIVAEPALFKNGQFERFPNQVEGDRCILYHYESVIYWQPLPSIPNK